MLKEMHIAVICSFLFMAALLPKAGYADAVSPEESDRILTRIFNKYIPIYTKFRGVESTGKSVIREYNARTRELKGTTEVIVHRKDYFYEKPEVKVLSYSKDGQSGDPDGYRLWEMKPGYHVFDRKGRDHYDLKIVDRKYIGKRECYRIIVLPKKATARHFKGEIYCTADTLDIVRAAGGAGSLDFPIKHFRAVFDYQPVNGMSMVQSGVIEILVDLPVIYPDTFIVIAKTVMESRLIEQQEIIR